MKILLIAEHDGHHLKAATRHALSAARHFGDDITVLVMGNHVAAVAQAAAQLAGVRRVLHADSVSYGKALPEALAPLIAQLGVGYAVILAGHTPFAKNVLPRAAALLDVAMVSDVVRIHSPDTFVRPIYAGNVLATVKASDALKLLSIRTTAFPAVTESAATAAPIETVIALETTHQTHWLDTHIRQTGRPELADARVVVAGGRALGSAENFAALLEPLADALGAALGASRAAVDAGYAPNDWQVGQTGAVVAPELYFAIGISGAVQHLAGMKDSKVIVAINNDPDAPIFQVADYGLVGDLFETVPKLQALLT